MSVVRIEALRALGQLIEARIPELVDRVCPADTPPNEFEELPNVSIIPGKWAFDQYQREEHAVLPGNTVVYNVGEHNCPCVISVMATSRTQRAAIEQKIVALFYGNDHPLDGMPLDGVIMIPITSCPELSRFMASFDLESDEWSDTYALDRRFESRIVIAAGIPALTIKTPVYTIDQLLLGVTEDMTTAFTPATAIPPAVELVVINEDGSISQP